MVATDIPTSDINTMLDLAVKAKQVPVSSVAIVPPLIQPGDPDFAVVRTRGAGEDRQIARPRTRKRRQPEPDAQCRASASTKAKKKSPRPIDRGRAQTNNLAKVCAA